MPRGRDMLKLYVRRLHEQVDDQHVVTRCSHCGWANHGSFADGRESFRLHLRDQHPDVRPGRRSRRNKQPAMLEQQDVEANIAAVRAQGGATWVNEEAA